MIDNDVLDWLQNDPWLTQADGAQELLNPLTSPKKRRITIADNGNKVELNYSLETLESQRNTTTFNSFPVIGKLPALRIAAWIRAFSVANRVWLTRLGSELQKELSKEEFDVLGPNGCQLMSCEPKDWFNQFIAIQLQRPEQREDPAHFDGGASLLHMGMTLYGRRKVHIKLKDANITSSSSVNTPAEESFWWNTTHQSPGSV